MKGVDVLRKTHLVPVRHHSPRSSAVLFELLERERPEIVLVEGPADATPLVPMLVHPETVPPVAILAYRTDGQPGSSLWPFASYSPEHVALAWAAKHAKTSAFIDCTAGQAIARHGTDERPAREDAPDAGELSVDERCVKALGRRSFEELWEAAFEAPRYEPDDFRAAIVAYADLVRDEDRSVVHRARDAVMASNVLGYVAKGAKPSSIAVVAGAAHVAAFLAGDVDLALAKKLPKAVKCALTVVPYSFPRLSAELGYGAGNRAPQYYQRAHEAGASFTRATLEVLIEFTEHLRIRGFSASMADTIEAYRLAVALAGLRNKAEPGLDEVREAATATLCRGDARQVDELLWPSVIGRRVGKVARAIGKNSLQEEFWREVEARRLPASDAVEAFTLKLVDKVQVATSVFLHRLRVADVPYASFVGTQRARRANPDVDLAGGIEALTRAAETWEAGWTPATDVALVEHIVLGETLETVAARVLDQRLGGARSTGEAALVLLEGVVTASPEAVGRALVACDAFAATDDDLPSLAAACRALAHVVSFGSSRALSSLGDEAVTPLFTKTFDRAVLRAKAACAVDDDAAEPVKVALRTLHEVALSQPLANKDAWLGAAHAIGASYDLNPTCAGLAVGLLYLARAVNDDEVATIVAQRLSDVAEPERAARFLEGFLEVNAFALVKSRAVVAALDAFLVGIDPARFKDALPILRRAFAGLGATERRYLVENVVAARARTEGGATEGALADADREKLAAMKGELDRAMDDLDDLL